jgi:hypothetical protein
MLLATFRAQTRRQAVFDSEPFRDGLDIPSARRTIEKGTRIAWVPMIFTTVLFVGSNSRVKHRIDHSR